MNNQTGPSQAFNPIVNEHEFEGIYGTYKITRADQLEVQRYRFAVFFCGIAFCAGLGQWILLGPDWASLWLMPMAIGLGLALKWIHIYLRPLHKALQIFWAIGCLGFLLLAFNLGPETMLSEIASKPIWTLAIGPLFAALTGLGFKEFFCFQRPEAIGLTVLTPIALLGHISGILNGAIVITLLSLSAILLFILALRKFGMEAAADVGDKSVFDYLDSQQTLKAL